MFKMIVKVWCLAEKEEAELKEIHKSIVSVLTGRKRIGVRNQRDLLVLFPPDLMSYGLGSEILIEVTFIQELRHETQEVFDGVSYALEDFIDNFYHMDTRVACLVESFDGKFRSRCFSH